MLAEHIIYSGAFAILAGMVVYRYAGRDPSWIIIISALAPDIDFFAHDVLTWFGFEVFFEGSWITHGTFHNILAMLIFGTGMAFLLHPLGIKFFDSLLFASLGFGAHLVEDALVYNGGYKFLWPLSSDVLGIALLPGIFSGETYGKDFFGIADSQVLIIGLVFLLAAILIRTRIEGSSSWFRWYLPDRIYRKFFPEKTMELSSE
jgi:hypothetical protein